MFHQQLDRYEQRVLKRENSITVSYKKKVARMLFIIVIIFIILHLPFTALIYMRTKLLQNLVMNQLEGGFYLLSCVSQFSLYLNATANPIIYGLTNDNFRRAYHQTPILPNLFSRWIHEFKQLHPKKVFCAYFRLYFYIVIIFQSNWFCDIFFSFYKQFTEYSREKAPSTDSTNYSSSHIGNSAKSDYKQNRRQYIAKTVHRK